MMTRYKSFLDIRLIWIVLGLSVIILKSFVSANWVEIYYSRGMFLNVRSILSSIGNAFDFPLIYLLIPGLLIYLGFKLKKLLIRKISWKQKLTQFLYSTAAFVLALIFLFQILWGFNYSRIPVETQLNIKMTPLNIAEIEDALNRQTKTIIASRNMLQTDSINRLRLNALSKSWFNPSKLNGVLESILKTNNFPVAGTVDGKIIGPKGILLRFGTSGIYLPFTGQGHIDGGLHPLQLPFVIAHEIAHGYGFADEGTCNFWAYLTCIEMKNPYVQYAGELAYWRYLASSFRSGNPEAYSVYRDQLPMSIQKDLNAINKAMARYPDLIPRIRNFTYNTYLKSQGISEGMANYNKIVPMVEAWKKR